jgi:hypothetical protein
MNNPPAFPTGNFAPDTFGMTLRDYFAAKAMQPLMANSGGYWHEDNLEQYALIAYKQADAMLKAREA